MILNPINIIIYGIKDPVHFNSIQCLRQQYALIVDIMQYFVKLKKIILNNFLN
jgi:hypothetical protein